MQTPFSTVISVKFHYTAKSFFKKRLLHKILDLFDRRGASQSNAPRSDFTGHPSDIIIRRNKWDTTLLRFSPTFSDRIFNLRNIKDLLRSRSFNDIHLFRYLPYIFYGEKQFSLFIPGDEKSND